MPITLIAIDPGANGGIAWRSRDGSVYADKLKNPVEQIREARRDITYVIVEDVGYHVKGNNAQASATFARGVGIILGALQAFCTPYTLCKPKAWIAKLGIESMPKSERKNHIKTLMKATYPAVNVTLATADALAMLTVCWDMLPGQGV